MINYEPKGWIKLHRDLETQAVFKDSDTLRLFLYLVCRAVTRDLTFRGVQIYRGQTVTTYGKLAKELEIKPRRVRHLLSRLISAQYVAHSTAYSGAHSFSVITICDFDNYQGASKGSMHNKRHNSVQGVAPSPPVSTFNNRKEEYIEKKSLEKDLTTPSTTSEEILIENLLNDAEWKKGVAESYQLSETDLIRRLDQFFASNRNRGKFHNDLRDLKCHFVDWLKKIHQSQSNNTQNGTILSGRQDKRRGVEAGNRRPEDFEEDF